jgi:segregation and condensation protein B
MPQSTGDDLPDLSTEQPGGPDSCELSPKTVFEAMLFVGGPGDQPLTATRAAELMRGVEPGEIPAMVEDLNGRYRETGCPYHVVHEGAGYRLTLRAEFEPLRAKFYGRVREARLSQAAVDVLAIVAYRQPVTAENVSILRDTPSGAILSQLVRRQLLRIERTAEKPRKTLYSTTDRFLKLFGLESLADLPQSEDLEGR